MLDYMIQCRRDLHRIPELERTLPETCAYVKGELASLPCAVTEPTEGAVCAYFDAGKPDTAAFRADMDALPIEEQTGLPFASTHPGRMHACGHDGHTAMLLGLARAVAARRDNLKRNVLLIFQPAEENGGGAKPLCDAGVLERYRVGHIFGVHLWPGVPLGQVQTRPGPMMAKSSEMTLYVRGKSVHISRWGEGLDSLWAAGEYLRRAYELERTALPPETPRLLRFGHMEAGRVRNAVAAEAMLEGTLRAFTLDDHALLRARCEELASAVAAETGCALRLTFSDGYPPVTNDPALLQRVRDSLGADAPGLYGGLSLSTEDFAWYQQYVPGVFFFLGVGDTEELHSARFVFDERVLAKGLALYERLLDLD